MSKTLKECLNYLGIENNDTRMIHKITIDSRECNENTIYIGNKYKDDALYKNSYILDNKYTRKLINYYYDHPSKHYFVIGVTGTNGKTSITSYLKQILTSLGYKCIRLGTHYNEIKELRINTNNTTMNIMDNLNIFFKYINEIDIIIMEISSIAIEEKRIEFIEFDLIIYSNISLDHLDYHKTFTQYMYSKFKLRKYLKENGKILINYDDINLHRIYELQRNDIYKYSSKDIQIIHNKLNDNCFIYKRQIYNTKLNGSYSFINLCACLKCLELMNLNINIDLSMICDIEGRMEIIEIQDKMIVIDYAHTPISLYESLKYLNRFKINQIICVFGCGGNRDKSKRPIMSKIACDLCDFVYVTEDNNRDEDFCDIVSDMDLKRFSNVNVIEKRENAILLALTQSKKHDIIYIGGKGNENYIEDKGIKIAYNDKAYVMSL